MINSGLTKRLVGRSRGTRLLYTPGGQICPNPRFLGSRSAEALVRQRLLTAVLCNIVSGRIGSRRGTSASARVAEAWRRSGRCRLADLLDGYVSLTRWSKHRPRRPGPL